MLTAAHCVAKGSFAGADATKVFQRRRIRLDTFGSRSLVVWNPGEAGAAGIADMPDDGWRGFVCLEAANASEDAIELEPGQRHRLSQVVSASAL